MESYPKLNATLERCCRRKIVSRIMPLRMGELNTWFRYSYGNLFPYHCVQHLVSHAFNGTYCWPHRCCMEWNEKSQFSSTLLDFCSCPFYFSGIFNIFFFFGLHTVSSFFDSYFYMHTDQSDLLLSSFSYGCHSFYRYTYLKHWDFRLLYFYLLFLFFFFQI